MINLSYHPQLNLHLTAFLFLYWYVLKKHFRIVEHLT